MRYVSVKNAIPVSRGIPRSEIIDAGPVERTPRKIRRHRWARSPKKLRKGERTHCECGAQLMMLPLPNYCNIGAHVLVGGEWVEQTEAPASDCTRPKLPPSKRTVVMVSGESGR